MALAFWRKTKESGSDQGGVAVEDSHSETERVEIPLPSRGLVGTQLSATELAEYIEVAKRVGIADSPAITAERLRHCLRDENIHHYNLEQVAVFLDAK